MLLHKLRNLSSQTVEREQCPPASRQRPTLNTKEDFRAWCLKSSTDHCFYSPWEGVNEGLRISRSNPAKLLHGFVADYDGNVTDDMIKEVEKVSALSPTWVTRTFSGGARLIWEFEEPLLLDNQKLADRFMKTLVKELGAKDMLPGFDEASMDSSQYFEIGDKWQKLPNGTPIPADLVGLWTFDSATGKVITTESSEIPLEEVAAEVERQFPGRWTGKFEVGSRGPLFWVNDGVNRVGCQVGDHGMICYSSRAEASFLPWEKVLGKAFTQKWEAQHIGGFLDLMWFDGKLYWWNVDSMWVGRTKEDSLMHLKKYGISTKTAGREVISKAEKVLCAVQDAKKVDFAAPLLFESQEVVDLNGDKVLNIGRRDALEEASVVDVTQFPWIHDFLTNIFVQPDGSNTQLDYFLAWLQRVWQTARDHKLSQGQMLVLAGEAGQGKTFLSRCIIGAALGGSVDASDILQGKTNFNKQAAEIAIWRIDDAASSASRAESIRFGETLKRHVANPMATYHPKFRDAIELPWKGRIVLTCNTDPNSLAILPSLDNTFADKIMMLKFGGYQPKFQPNHAHEAMVAAEMPFFLAWLKQWSAPAHVVGVNNRFGVNPYHHKELVEASRQGDSSTSLIEVLEMWRQGEVSVADCDPVVSVTATDLLGRIRTGVPGGSDLMRQYSVVRMGRELHSLLGRYDRLLKVKRASGVLVYEFNMN